MNKNRLFPPLAVWGFLLPNFLGFVAFTLLPVALSFVMAFTNWNMKPMVPLEFLGLRNFTDLLGVRSLGDGRPALCWVYVVSAVALAAGLMSALWANVNRWPGTRVGGVVLFLAGWCAVLSGSLSPGHSQVGILISGVIGILCGLAVVLQDELDWRWGRGAAPAILIASGAAGLWFLDRGMWEAYEPRDRRFWYFFYNTVYLMLGIPFSIAGSLCLALLVNENLGMGVSARRKALGASVCAACGVLTLIIVWGLGFPNAAILGAVFWGIAALGAGFNIVAFRTIFYLPTFTAGVAMMVLWKALYNPLTGPINIGLASMFGGFAFIVEDMVKWLASVAGPHLGRIIMDVWTAIGATTIEDMPKWLASVAWAKPALIFMGVWTAIGGTTMLLYLAGLANIPRDLLDAAEVDGAGAWNRFRHVTWPQLAPTTFFISIMAIIGGFQAGFDQARVMTNGGPAESTMTLSFYIYRKAFLELDLGYASAVSWVLFGVIFVATIIYWKVGKGVEVDI